MRAQEFITERKKRSKKTRGLGGYFFPGYGFYGGDSGEGGGDGGGGGESKQGMLEAMAADQVLDYVKRTHAPEEFDIEYSITDHPEWELKTIPLSQLNLDPDGEAQDPYNRVNWVDDDKVQELIPRIGSVLKSRPIVVDPAGWIIDGNHRAMAAVEAGLTSVPALVPIKQHMAEGSEEINWIKPNFDYEWDEIEFQAKQPQVPADVRNYMARHFPNKQAWMKSVQHGRPVVVSPDHGQKIRNYTDNKQDLLNALSPQSHDPQGPAKAKRVNALFDKGGPIEMPIILQTEKGLWLIGGKTRLGTANLLKGIPAKVWMIGGEQGVAEDAQLPGDFKLMGQNLFLKNLAQNLKQRYPDATVKLLNDRVTAYHNEGDDEALSVMGTEVMDSGYIGVGLDDAFTESFQGVLVPTIKQTTEQLLAANPGTKPALFLSTDNWNPDAWTHIASKLGYRLVADDEELDENFADGKNPGRKGLAKRSGVNTKASVSSLRKTAKNSSGEKQRMAHWLANMKAGRAKAKKK